jgi:DNA-binding Lrp family transcriptional regulator
MQNQNSVFSKDKYLLLSELGTRLNLSFSSHVRLGDRLIALDGIKKKLLVLEHNNDQLNPRVIDLDKVNDISVRTNYRSIKPGELKRKKIDEFLRTIELQFNCNDEPETFVLPFSDSDVNDRKSLAMLEKNARNWQLILSKMINVKKNEVIPKAQTAVASQF